MTYPPFYEPYPFSYEFNDEFQSPPPPIGFKCNETKVTIMKKACNKRGCAYVPAITVCNQTLYTSLEIKDWNYK
jgi:hypothetical protein